eukprot:6089990-Heterocapsa_arctica.AAC.1
MPAARGLRRRQRLASTASQWYWSIWTKKETELSSTTTSAAEEPLPRTRRCWSVTWREQDESSSC